MFSSFLWVLSTFITLSMAKGRAKKITYPCPVCDKSCGGGTIHCTGCDMWVHPACVPLTDAEFEEVWSDRTVCLFLVLIMAAMHSFIFCSCDYFLSSFFLAYSQRSEIGCLQYFRGHFANRHITISQLLPLWRRSRYDVIRSRIQVDVGLPSTRRRLRSVPPPPPLRPLTRRLNASCCWFTANQTRTYVICLGLLVSPRI